MSEYIQELKKLEPLEGGIPSGSEISDYQSLLTIALAEKGVSPDAVAYLATEGYLGSLLDAYMLGNGYIGSGFDRIESAQTLNKIAKAASREIGRHALGYTGTIFENRDIIRGDYRFDGSERIREIRRNGAQRIFETDHSMSFANELAAVPIAVVGAGAAGVLTARALMELGFVNVQVFDRKGEVGGIWNQPNVADGTKNNPFDIEFDDSILRRAERRLIEGSGGEVKRFIDEVAEGDSSYHYTGEIVPTKAVIKEIEPGDLSHRIRLVEGGVESLREYPIVIYAPGTGKPLPLSHAGHMETPVSTKEGGVRWQQQLSREKLGQLEGKRLVFVGLGNSTAEMLYQIQEHERETGSWIDYRVLTHYPHRAIRDPEEETVGHESIFRDTKKPVLTRLAGDLEHINDVFDDAEKGGKIIADVANWYVENNICVVTDKDGVTTSIPYDGLYTLTGYRQEPDDLRTKGITVIEDYHGVGAFDYDGEVQCNPGALGRERLYPGYFAIGPITRTRFNPNAVVIPGIQYQLSDMLPTIAMRAAEHVLRSRNIANAA